MCIAIYKAADKIISKATLQECFNRNSDGAGFSYVKDGELRINKGYFSFKAFYSAYKRFEQKQMVIHFRIKTHGAVAVENCHPFFVQKDLAFIHNGIISQHSGNTDISDTRDFNENILKPMVKQFGTTIIFTDTFKTMVEDYIGFSKLIFMDVNGNYSIMNESKGVWDEGIWYSNNSYKVYKPVYNATPAYYKEPSKQLGYPSKSSSLNVYYIERGNKRIYEGELARVRHFNSFSVPVGSKVTVTFLSSKDVCDIELPNGIIIPDFPIRSLDYVEDDLVEQTNNLFDDTYSLAEISNGFYN